MKVLPNLIALVLTDSDKEGHHVDPSLVLDELCKELGQAKIGCSIESGSHGIYVPDRGDAMVEGNTVLSVSFSAEQWPYILGVLMKFSALSATVLNQAEIALRLNGTLVLAETSITMDQSKRRFLTGAYPRRETVKDTESQGDTRENVPRQ